MSLKVAKYFFLLISLIVGKKYLVETEGESRDVKVDKKLAGMESNTSAGDYIWVPAGAATVSCGEHRREACEHCGDGYITCQGDCEWNYQKHFCDVKDYLPDFMKNRGVTGDVKRNTEIGAIARWGPQFTVSLDLKIHSWVKGWWGWSNILDFKSDGGKTNMRKYGDRIPSIFAHRKGFLHFTSAVNGNKNYAVNFHRIALNKWNKIYIYQSKLFGKFYYIINVNGKQIHRVENKNPRTFKDVRVFAGNKFYPAADASYKILDWNTI